MFRRIFGFGKNKKTIKPQEKDASVLIKDFPSESLNHVSASQVVALRSPESESALRAKKDSAELFTEAVNKLVLKLEGINTSLDLQVHHNQQLVEKLERLPELLSCLPQTVERQEKIFEDIASQMQRKNAQDEHTAEALSGIHEKVAACAEVETKMSEHFVDFGRSLKTLDENTLNQTECLQLLNRSYTSAEQYLRETIHKQQKRFYWLFGVCLAVCVLTAAALIAMTIATLSR